MNSATMLSPRSVTVFRPSTNTGATGSSKVPGSEIPMLACQVDENDELHILIEDPPENLRKRVEAAVAACPRAALRLVGS